jgi:pyrimidine-nucleoside phosphorylase
VRSQKAVAPDRPFFLYYAPGVTHSPHHPKKEWIAKYKGKFDQGWDKLREETLARQKKLGIVPADTKLYALRDVTATVESIPLITASILSKKVAEGAQSLVFDVKCGPGAFMKTQDEARALAASLVNTGGSMGKKVVALITDMSEPLGLKVGNFFEIEETLDCLEGKGPEDVMALTLRLGAWMLVSAGKASTVEAGEALCRTALSSGKALELFYNNVSRQGGDLKRLAELRGKYRSSYSVELKAPASGHIASIDAYLVGLAGVMLGVGRNTTADQVRPDVGFIFSHKKGDAVTKGDPVAAIYGKDQACLGPALELAAKALKISEKPPRESPLVLEELSNS